MLLANNVIEMNSSEKQVTVDLLPDSVTAFTKDNLNTLISIRSKEAYPMIYGTQRMRGIELCTTSLVDMDKVIVDNKYFAQLARATVNTKKPIIRDDITTNGYSLAELPIMVMRRKGGTFVIIEGRTRFEILQELGMKNIIADVFEETSMANLVRFAIFMNTTKKPFGEASVEDILKGILFLIETNEIKSYPDTVEGRQQLRDVIIFEMESISGRRLTESQKGEIVGKATDRSYGFKQIYSFPKGEGTFEWLIEHGYNTEEDKENGILYVPVASFEEKIYKVMMTQQKKIDSNVKEIRYVLYLGTPNAAQPEKSWLDGVKDFGTKFNSYEEAVSNLRFHGTRIDNTLHKIYGGIPQITSLSKKYPMDKLYIYKNVK